MANPPDELDRMKAEINLSALAASLGYEIDRRASSKNSIAMKHPNGDKIVVGFNGRHWVYFSVHGHHRGSVIDLVQHCRGVHIGHARQELRPWLDGGPDGHPQSSLPPESFTPRPRPVEQDILAVRAAYAAAEPLNGHHPYLCNVRRIPPTVLAAERFANVLRVDQRGNAVAPHSDADGLCGFELRNDGFRGYAKGGRKGLWLSEPGAWDERLVFVEGFIDALSYAALHGHAQTQFVSVSGQLNDTQPLLIWSVLEQHPEARIVLAFDRDEAGERLSVQMETLCLGIRGSLSACERHQPPNTGQDWNDVLRACLGEAGHDARSRP